MLEWKEEHMASRNQTTCMQIRRLGIDFFFAPSWKFASLIGVEIGYFLYYVSYQNHLLLAAPTVARRTHPNKSRVPQQDSRGSDEVEAAKQGSVEATGVGAREGGGTGPVEAADAGSHGHGGHLRRGARGWRRLRG